MFRTVLCLLLAAWQVSAQVRRDDMRILRLDYELRVLEDTQTLEVTLQVDDIDREQLNIAMPEWTPGSYAIRGFGDWVTNLKAVDSDSSKEIAIEKIDRSTWTLATAGVSSLTISYRIEPRQRRFTNFKPAPEKRYSGMHIQAPNTFLYVVGHERGTPVTCRYLLPDGWQVANGMNLTSDPFLRRAKDYDTFVDNPTILGRFQRRNFESQGAEFSCVFWSPTDNYDWDLDGFTAICKQIVSYQASIFGGFPFRRYVFLFTVSSFGGGGLEHLTSTSIGLSDGAMKNNINNGASITAHEFFHTWNVKRIRPESLGPFHYGIENYSSNLWVAEGWTSYYGDITLMRTGLISPEQYLAQMAHGIAREGAKERRKEHSVTWASRHVWHKDDNNVKGGRVDYYTKGEILGLLIDLKIRQTTDGKKSLDDVMSFLNRWFAEHDQGYAEDDIERACTAVSNHDFREFFARYVSGQMDPPYDEFFSGIGLEYRETQLKSAFPFSTRNDEEGMQVRFLRAEARESGLQRGDLIVAVNGEFMTSSDDFLESHAPGEKIKLSIKRAETQVEIEIELLDLPRQLVSLQIKPGLSESEARLLKGWMEAK